MRVEEWESRRPIIGNFTRLIGKAPLSERLIHSFLHAVPLRSSLKIPCSRIDLDPERTSSIRPTTPTSTVAKRGPTCDNSRDLLTSFCAPLFLWILRCTPAYSIVMSVGSLPTTRSSRMDVSPLYPMRSSEGRYNLFYKLDRRMAHVGLRRFSRATQLASACGVGHGHPECTPALPILTRCWSGRPNVQLGG